MQKIFNCENELINEVRLDSQGYVYGKIYRDSKLIKVLGTKIFANITLVFSHPIPDPVEDMGRSIIKNLNRE